MGRRGRVRKFGTDNGFEEHGGYMAAKKAKLEEQFEKEAKAEGEREGIFRYIISLLLEFPRNQIASSF